MRIQTSLDQRAKVTRGVIAAVIAVVVLIGFIFAVNAVNAGGACQATYIDHSSGGGVTKAACAK